jgi:adenylate kinase
MIRVVEARLDTGNADDAYMFDGFPRTVNQAELLDRSLQGRGGRIETVFFLDAPRDVLIRRLCGRRVCRKCGAVYHVENMPPREEGVCDQCGGDLYQRADDQEATIENRLEVYAKQTQSLISRYEEAGQLKRIDSSQGVDVLVGQIASVLEA